MAARSRRQRTAAGLYLLWPLIRVITKSRSPPRLCQIDQEAPFWTTGEYPYARERPLCGFVRIKTRLTKGLISHSPWPVRISFAGLFAHRVFEYDGGGCGNSRLYCIGWSQPSSVASETIITTRQLT
ncbi:hypothetical protein F4778DRAFT_348332 [Xylariomycetidae sp. FL2044]|nr:hypothetical protein F4778DRAFT_348332 [Xylariomycetidae sp. FL2044]